MTIMKYIVFSRALMEIATAFLLWFNWADLPTWIIALICLSFFLDGIASLLESFRHHLKSKLINRIK